MKLKDLYEKNKELIIYIVVGVLTTIVNFFVYYISTRLFLISPYMSNVISWIFAVLFAFVANKFIVFKSMNRELKILLKEGISFISMRIISLGFDMFIMYLAIDVISLNDLIAKCVAQVVVTLSNYAFSKLIFKNKK